MVIVAIVNEPAMQRSNFRYGIQSIGIFFTDDSSPSLQNLRVGRRWKKNQVVLRAHLPIFFLVVGAIQNETPFIEGVIGRIWPEKTVLRL